MRHNLKIEGRWFEAVECGRKKAEIRRADRPFHVGDEVLLYLHDKTRALVAEITDILALEEVPGCNCRGYVSLSIDVRYSMHDATAIAQALDSGSFG